MDLSGKPDALLSASNSGARLGQPRALYGGPYLGGDGREQPQLILGEPPVVGSREVHDAEGLLPEVQGNAGVVAKATSGIDFAGGDGGREAAALKDINVFWIELALLEVLNARARIARHSHRFAEKRRKVQRGRAVEVPGVGIS